MSACPDRTDGGPCVFLPDEEYAQKKGVKAPVCCEHCGAMSGVLADAMAAANEKGSDSPDKIQLWEAYFKGARYRMRVCIGDEYQVLTLQGARKLQRKLDAAIRRLERK